MHAKGDKPDIRILQRLDGLFTQASRVRFDADITRQAESLPDAL